MVLQSDTLLLMLGHDASLAKQREGEKERKGGRGSVEKGTKVTTGKAIKERKTDTIRKENEYHVC